MKLRVAGAQVEVGNDVRQNVETIGWAIRQAGDAQADILLTPEGSLSGYRHDFDFGLVQDGLREVISLAQQMRVGLALGTCYTEADGCTYNQVRFYMPGGDFLGFHSKILRCGTLADPSEGEVNHFTASELKIFTFQGVRIGGLICNDLWANPTCTPMPDPHLSQQLARMGARVIFHAVNGGRDGSQWSEVAWQFHEANLRMRANAGGLWVVTVDNCSPTTLPCSAPSGVVDPQGKWACRTETRGRQFFVYDIEL